MGLDKGWLRFILFQNDLSGVWHPGIAKCRCGKKCIFCCPHNLLSLITDDITEGICCKHMQLCKNCQKTLKRMVREQCTSWST